MNLLKMGVAAWVLATAAIALLSLSQPANSADTPAPTFAKEVKPSLSTLKVEFSAVDLEEAI